MGSFLFVLFVIFMSGYLYVYNHNENLKKDFHSTLYQCGIVIREKVNKNTKCLADGSPCYLQQDMESIKGMLCLAENYRTGRKLWFDDKIYGQDLYKSAHWYEKLALKNYPKAQFEMAKIYQQGIGVPQDLKNANAWYYQAYLSGHLESGFIFANHLAQGLGIEKNYQQALYLYNKLASFHYEPAIFKMGVIYDDGLFGIQENNQIALQYFSKIPNYTGVSGVNGKIYKIELEISVSIDNSTKANQLVEQIPQKQSSSNTNKTYPSAYYGHDSECTAICWDGTCSKSLGRRGVCSRHGGVKHWLDR